ncbi:MAG: hypothetical protein ABEH35_01445 [Haloarculaceae archaeon]
MTRVADRWRSYFRTRRQPAVEAFAAEYPDDRSVHVDLIDLHDFDSDLVGTLFDDPDRVLSVGADTLRNVADVSGPVHVRVENNPHQCSVSEVRARHLHRLVTVDAVVESVGAPQAMVVSAAFECPACEELTVREQTRVELDIPLRCDACGGGGEFTFRPGASAFVDLQEITLAPAATTQERRQPDRTLVAYLDDDLVGAVTEGDNYSVTGILRPLPGARSNQFSLSLDAVAVREEHQHSTPDSLDDVLDSHWGVTAE